jgi:pimeloyl-ACP methyl ester carboxylesterase
MLLNKRILQSFAVILAVLVALMFYEDVNPMLIEKEFSFNMNSWLNRGNFFVYKDLYKIFYIREDLPTLVSSEESEESTKSEEDATVLFLHGFPTSSFDFYKVWNQFKSNNLNLEPNTKIKSLLALDFLGYGFSDKPLNYDYSIFDMADMVDKLLMNLNISRVYLVAHDVGDTVALELLRRDNLKNQLHFKIDRLVMLNGGIILKLYKPILSQDVLRTKYLNRFFVDNFFKFFIFKHSFVQIFGDLKPPNVTELWDFFLGIKYKNGNKVLPLTINYIAEREQYGDVWLDALNETTMPVQFIYGPADPINPRSRFPQELRENMPKVKLNILSDLVGHYPQCEDPFTVFELIRMFFL